MTLSVVIGANLGYTSAHIFSLWSPGHNFNGKTLHDAIKSDVDNKSSEQKQGGLDTVCADQRPHEPLVCLGRNEFDVATARIARQDVLGSGCSFRRKIKVVSFDGQISHVLNQQKTVYKHFPYLNPKYTGSISITI